jgi:hypothetical protein
MFATCAQGLPSCATLQVCVAGTSRRNPHGVAAAVQDGFDGLFDHIRWHKH